MTAISPAWSGSSGLLRPRLAAVALAATVVAVVVVAGGWLRYRIETWETDRG